MAQTATLKVRRSWLSHTGLAAGLTAALLPKCPLCLMAYAGVLGISGIDPFIYGLWVKPVVIGFSVFTMAILFFQAKRNRRYFPFVLASAAIIIILSDKFYLNTNWAGYVGMAALFVSAVCLSIPKKAFIKNDNCAC